MPSSLQALFPMAVSSAGAGVALDTFQMRGSWEATPWSAFLAAKLLNSFSFSTGSIFEGFNYLGFHEDSPVGFLLACHIPPTQEPMVYLSLGRTHPVVWMSHLCLASHIYPCRWFWGQPV